MNPNVNFAGITKCELDTKTTEAHIQKKKKENLGDLSMWMEF